MFGLLNIDKPTGCTSRDAVNRIQRLVRPAKIGHCGTLDPLASGVLVIALGAATRLVEYVQQMPKHYRAQFLLGYSSPTEDVDGTVTAVADPRVPTRDEIHTILPQFHGTILQRPPAYSALKVNGERAYDLARRGESVVLEPREIVVYGIEVISYEYPRLELDVICGSGTYIRSLGRDLAEALGTSSVMEALTRTAIGPFHLSAAISVEQIEQEGITPFLLPPHLALHPRPELALTEFEQLDLLHGRPIQDRWHNPADELVALSPSHELVAILSRRNDNHQTLWPTKTFR